jgi:glycosyltransferase involved in cell wall biosynthesis
MALIDAVFVASESSLASHSGGVQLCTAEYFKSLELAGFKLHLVTFSPDNRLWTKVVRKVKQRPYSHIIPPELPGRIADAVRRTDSRFVFLNQCDVLERAEQIKRACGQTRIVFLSHGLASVDFLHELRARGNGLPFEQLGRGDVLRLGRQLVEECRQRQSVDCSICLSPVEVEIERWLGVPQVTWIPRTIEPRFLEWAPQSKRVGFVGTLNHPPNVEGLVQFLRHMARENAGITVRVVGGPHEAAKALLKDFSFVEYLGPLDDELLRREAATWQCFLHPLFCFARGASTKLAVGLSWGIPIVTTSSGRRGYVWSEGQLIEANEPGEYVAEVRRLCETQDYAERVCGEVRAIATHSPKLTDVARDLRGFLSGA